MLSSCSLNVGNSSVTCQVKETFGSVLFDCGAIEKEEGVRAMGSVVLCCPTSTTLSSSDIPKPFFLVDCLGVLIIGKIKALRKAFSAVFLTAKFGGVEGG